MKFSLVFLIALALSGAANIRASPVRSASELNDIFEEFLALVPKEKIVEIFLQYLDEDPEVQAIVEYVQTDDFKELVKKVESIDDVINFYDYLHESGLDIYGAVNQLHEAIGLPPLVPGKLARNVKITGGFAGLIDDVMAVLPLDDIKALYHEKLETSPAFAQLIERFRSPNFQKLINALRANKEFQKIVRFGKEAGVDINKIKELLTTVLGLQFPDSRSNSLLRIPRANLHDDLEDFLALLPIDQMVEIALDYYENDPEIAKTIEYLRSDAFSQIVQEVGDMKEARDVLAFLQESGLDVYGLLNTVHEFLGLPPFKPSLRAVNRVSRATGGISGFIADLKAILPIEDIKALYHKKLQDSPAFIRFVERLSSRQFQEFVDAVLMKEEVRVIINKLKAHGVDVQEIADYLTTIFGLQFPKRIARGVRNNLHDDLEDFLALLPIDQMVEIALDYYENDPEIAKTIEYLRSDAFSQIVQEVGDMKEARDVLAFLQESGLDVYGLLNTVHEFLGLPPFKPSLRAVNRVSRATGGISGFIADLKAILPIEDIKALYHKKLQDSPAFIRFVERLSSRQFQEFVDAVLMKEEVRVIINKLKAHGVDVQEIADYLTTIFGLQFPKRIARGVRNNLHDDLEDFLALLPIDQMVEIALDYYENDPEIAKTIEYLRSDAFSQIVQEVGDMKEARDVLAFLQESGLDVYGLLNTVHEFLGLPPFKPSLRAVNRVSRATGGISGFIADLKAILPIEDIKALYHKKLQDSPAFIRFVERLSSRQFQEFVDAVLIKEEVRVIINKLKAHGVDLQEIADYLTTIFGLQFPKPAMARASEELVKDLVDFFNLMPLEDVIDIAVDYLFNDVEVQKAAAYIRTDEFKVLATDAQQNDEFRSFLGYLDRSGLPASEYINKLNELLEIPNVVPSSGLQQSRRTGKGIRGMLDDIEALIPHVAIKNLYDHKMKTSKAFIFFIERLQAPEFQTIVDKLVENKAFQKLGYRAAELGIDLSAIVEFLGKVFGIEISPDLLPFRLARTLQDDLQEFVNLLPTKEIRKIAIKYYLTDEEFKRAYNYIQSEEFYQLIRNLHEIPEYNELLKSLEETGIDVEGAIAQIHTAIGFPNVRSFINLREARGIASFVSEVKAILPINDIKALYHKKLETSKDFVRLVELISSEQFQAVTDALFADEIFKSILHQLQHYGIDLKVVSDLFLTVFGIKTPPGVIDY